jgi:hypothetical protein
MPLALKLAIRISARSLRLGPLRRRGPSHRRPAARGLTDRLRAAGLRLKMLPVQCHWQCDCHQLQMRVSLPPPEICETRETGSPGIHCQWQVRTGSHTQAVTGRHCQWPGPGTGARRPGPGARRVPPCQCQWQCQWPTLTPSAPGLGASCAVFLVLAKCALNL